ncbi:uncharacterized protein LOC129764285 isoform X2 [Toxorhynchites rutilus septentrionalis]|uniref:uncharacterized protein LOC129764285 isoform X2 n=1 Tax=Toxorhynchites rutilus septentrionalis TaxID=329112 RepID=UPI002479F0E0|nr:uncharacterized protein LOC129764285 isoform X2 [Toxorhynchites rutilus septentrionalis]
MNGDSKKESFKLLQLSDESKSLSDLELPEITTQRKRKVRRKTRQRTASIRHDDDRSGIHIDCRNFSLWLAILMTVLWLFIISYITSVVHNENRRLEMAIQKVSASSQNLPEALQRWHETSKTLEQNQTALNGKLREVQQVLSNFSAELKQLRDTIEKKNENSQEAQLNSLKTNVADIGSKIGDAIARISALEERYAVTTTDQKTVRKSVDELQTLIAQIRNGSAPASTNSATNNATEQSIANIREELSTQIANLAQNFTTELETLNQKNSWLDKDLKSHKTSIDQLVENSANISSHVKSVENIWVEMKNNLTYLDSGTRQIYNQLEMLQNATNGLKGSISSVREECDHYHAQNDVIANEISSIKTRLEKAEKKVIPATVPTTIATGPPKDPLSQLFNKPTESTASKPSQSAREQNSHQGVFPESQQAGKQASVAQQQPSASPPSTSAITTTTTLTSNSQNLKSDATYNGM